MKTGFLDALDNSSAALPQVVAHGYSDENIYGCRRCKCGYRDRLPVGLYDNTPYI